jgi:hypothetical protein
MAKWIREAMLLLFTLVFRLKKAFGGVNIRLLQTTKSVETDFGGFADLGNQNFRLFQG